MGNYKNHYENYYKSIRGKEEHRPQTNSIEYLAQHGSGKRGRGKKSRLSFVTLFIFQCVGSLILLLGFVLFKAMPGEQADKAYIESKNILSENQIDTTEIQKLDILDLSYIKEAAISYVEKLKNLVGGEEELKAKLKKEYVIPVKGKVEKTVGEGVFLYTLPQEQVKASFEGKVKEVINKNGSAVVVINHGEGIETYYGLLKESTVKTGDEVKKGDCIGYTGKLLPQEKDGMEFRVIYMGEEKAPLDYMDFKEALD